jgi:hypothetical protein
MRGRRKGWRVPGRDAHPDGDRNCQARSGFPRVTSATARTIPLLRACNRRLSGADYSVFHREKSMPPPTQRAANDRNSAHCPNNAPLSDGTAFAASSPRRVSESSHTDTVNDP